MNKYFFWSYGLSTKIEREKDLLRFLHLKKFSFFVNEINRLYEKRLKFNELQKIANFDIVLWF